MPGTGTAQAAQANLAPGSVFGVPGYTQKLEQYDAITGFSTPLANAAQTAFNPPGSFQKTDVIFWWELVVNTFTLTAVPGTGPLWSPYAPYNLFQNLSVKMQGKYLPLEVLSGVDAAIFQLIRPMRGQSAYSALLGANAFQNFQNANTTAGLTFAQTNLTNALPANVPAPGSFTFTLELPGSLWIDEYWDLAQNGRLMPNANGVVAPMGAFVSPQYMGGGERVVLPKFQYAALSGTNSDNGPILGSGTAAAGSVSVDTRRIGVYGSQNVAELPPVFNWQYRRHSYEYPIGNSNQVTIPIQDYGQILSIFVRLYDPGLTVASEVGAPYPIANVSKCQVLYGSNLLKYDDVPYTMQKRFLDQHGFLPPIGTLIWDMAIKNNNTPVISNAGALNTLTNANCKIFLQFTPTLPSASSYAVVGLEYLPFVSQS